LGRYEEDPLAVYDFPTWGLKTALHLYKTGPMTVFTAAFAAGPILPRM
jgi:hypothetical protein